jgi:hypothetical protein
MFRFSTSKRARRDGENQARQVELPARFLGLAIVLDHEAHRPGSLEGKRA